MLSALINAGGSSTRMGTPKALLPMPPDERPLLAYVVETAAAVVDGPIYVIANHPPVQEIARRLPNVILLSDKEQGKGPLAGLAAGLAFVPGWTLALACDLPLLQGPLLQWLAELCAAQREAGYDALWDAIVPVVDGRAETLCAAYHRRCLPLIQSMLIEDRLRIRDLLSQVRVRYVEEDELRQVDPTLQSFTNANTPQEWAAIRQKLHTPCFEAVKPVAGTT
jgi:molybdopterin-guanine dinucleotide biosynthesis protein A